MENIIKVGLDVHGVIGKDPDLFATLTHKLVENNHEVHILTGRELCTELIDRLHGFGVIYNQIFSITSYHKKIGTHIVYKDNDPTQPLIAPPKWNRTKADYAKRVGLNIHIDDSIIYGEYFHYSTQYMLYTPAIKSFLILCLGNLKPEDLLIEHA